MKTTPSAVAVRTSHQILGIWLKNFLHQHNSRINTFVIAMAKINNLKFKFLPTHLVPSEYFIFPNLKKWLSVKRFAKNEKVDSEANVSIKIKEID